MITRQRGPAHGWPILVVLARTFPYSHTHYNTFLRAARRAAPLLPCGRPARRRRAQAAMSLLFRLLGRVKSARDIAVNYEKYCFVTYKYIKVLSLVYCENIFMIIYAIVVPYILKL